MTKISHLKDIAIIMTADSYFARVDSNVHVQSVKYIYAPKKFVFGKTFFYEQKGGCNEKGFVILAKPNYEIQYISFLLNSLIIALGLCDGQLSKPAVVTKKKLENLPLRDCDNVCMYALGKCNRIIQVIKKRLDSEPENEVCQFHYNLFSEIRDGMSMELLTQPLFQKFEIHIIDEWEKLLFERETQPNIVELVNILMEDNNELMNQVRKMRNVISNIGKLLSEKGNNGLEDK